MPRIYHQAIGQLNNLRYWALDYVYVCLWQLKGLFARNETAHYLHTSHTELIPILLLPGIYEKWHFMKPIADLLHKKGHAVHIVSNLGYNTGSVEDMARVVEVYVREHNISTYTIVAHSKGGLIAKYLLMYSGSRIRQVITINTPFGGSRYAGLFIIKNIRMFLATSPIMRTLAANTDANQHIVSIYGRFDPHVPGGSYLDGATNIQIDTYGHFCVMNDPLLHETILKVLQSEDSK